jgi:hypothetical protein
MSVPPERTGYLAWACVVERLVGAACGTDDHEAQHVALSLRDFVMGLTLQSVRTSRGKRCYTLLGNLDTFVCLVLRRLNK